VKLEKMKQIIQKKNYTKLYKLKKMMQ